MLPLPEKKQTTTSCGSEFDGFLTTFYGNVFFFRIPYSYINVETSLGFSVKLNGSDLFRLQGLKKVVS